MGWSEEEREWKRENGKWEMGIGEWGIVNRKSFPPKSGGMHRTHNRKS
jgi:hypothetical protein